MIPSHKLGNILRIWDYIVTFKEDLKITIFSVEDLYIAFNNYVDNEIPLISEIFIALLYGYADEISNQEISNLTDEPEILLFKMAIDFTSKRSILKCSWIEILRIVIFSKSFDYLVNDEIKDIGYRLKKTINNKNINLLSYDEKVLLLEFLVNTSFDFLLIRDSIKESLYKKAELKRKKYELEGDLRITENRKKELEITENSETIQQAIDAITISINNFLEENPGISRQESAKLKKELETEREKKKETLKEFEITEDKCLKIINQIEKLKEDIIGESLQTKKLLGYDIYRNEYYVRIFWYYL